jgi:hypothetical protein
MVTDEVDCRGSGWGSTSRSKMHTKAITATVLLSLLAELVLLMVVPRDLAAHGSQEVPQIQETTEPFGNLRHPELVIEDSDVVPPDGYEACAAKYLAVSTDHRVILLLVTEHAHTKEELLLTRSKNLKNVYNLLHREGSVDRGGKGNSHGTALWLEDLDKSAVQVRELVVIDKNGRHRIAVQKPSWQ